MTTFTAAAIALQTYPERNPFDLEVENLSPPHLWMEDCDSPEFRKAALEIALRQNGYNVLSGMYGSNPFPLDYNALSEAERPAVEDQCHSHIPEIELPSTTRITEEIELWSVPAFVLRSDCWEDDRLLKMVRSVYVIKAYNMLTYKFAVSMRVTIVPVRKGGLCVSTTA